MHGCHRAQPTPPTRSLAVLAVALLVQPATARAQADTNETHARDAFELGVLLGHAQRWAEALDAFRRSYALAARPRTCFNLGLAMHHVGRMREAATTLQRCLTAPTTAADAALADDTRELLRVVTRALGTLELVVQPPEADLRVDGEFIEGGGGAHVLALDPGLHRVQLSSDGTSPQEFTLPLTAGQRVLRRVDLRVLPARMVIRAPSPDALVSVDDDPTGRGVTEWLGPPGAHRVRVELPEHQPWRGRYALTPGQRLDIAVALEPVPRPIYRNPWLWVGVSAAVMAAAAVIVYAAVPGETPVDAGSTGQIIPVGTR